MALQKRSWVLTIKLTKKGLDALNQHNQEIIIGVVGRVKFLSIQEEKAKSSTQTIDTNPTVPTSTPMETDNHDESNRKDLIQMNTDNPPTSTNLAQNTASLSPIRYNLDDTLAEDAGDDLQRDGEAIINTETLDQFTERVDVNIVPNSK